ncbi:hypothetical protein C8R44DRAFT_860237 [Mycena epipterygia]|nr:hypothetical protein C8R44DRAFT_860237 [Mycena epipterygia]
MRAALRANGRKLVAHRECGVFGPHQEICHGVESLAWRWWWWLGVAGATFLPFGLTFELEAAITRRSGLRAHVASASAAQTGAAAAAGSSVWRREKLASCDLCAPRAEGVLVERRRRPSAAGLPPGSVCRGRDLDACYEG